jgi:hypothetical protein
MGAYPYLAAISRSGSEDPPCRNTNRPGRGLRLGLGTPEVLARVQATDARFDGSPADGALSQHEASAVPLTWRNATSHPVPRPRGLAKGQAEFSWFGKT